MKDFLLSRANRSPGRRETATVALTEERGDTFFDALSSETSRRLFQALHEQPSTPSELAEQFDTSRQNVHYHVEKLEAADLVEPIDTVYSSRGREMRVYAPTHEAVVLVSGSESTVDRVRSALSRFLGGLAALLVVSLLLQAAVVGLPDLGPNGAGAPAEPDGSLSGDSGSAGGGDGGDAGAVASPTPSSASETAPSGGDGAQPSAGDAAGPTATAPTPEQTAVPETAPHERTDEEASSTDTPTATATESPTATSTPTATPAPAGTDISPAVYFLAGGVFVLVGSAIWRFRG